MGKIFAVDGPVISFLNKVGQLIMLTVIWIACCIPVITLCSACSAYYYAVIKSVRREVGYPVREYFAAFKRNLLQGIAVTFVLAAWAYLLYINMNYIQHIEDQMHLVLYLGNLVLIILTLCLLIYLFPVMSRFAVSKRRWFKMAAYLMIARLPYTALLAAAIVLMAWLTFFYIPVVGIVIMPGVYCYFSTYLIEPALKRFMPKKAEGEEKEWFDE